MKIFDELKRAFKVLEPYQEQWAICGGVAASIYRDSPRFTDDIDLAVIDGPELTAEELARKAITSLGYKEYLGIVPDPVNPGKSMKGLLCARTEDDVRFAGIDFLLTNHIWVQNAVEAAQDNKIDYGFAEMATITQESLIFAKLIAVQGTPERLQDVDDITQILSAGDIDKDWIKEQVKQSPIDFRPDVLELIN